MKNHLTKTSILNSPPPCRPRVKNIAARAWPVALASLMLLGALQQTVGQGTAFTYQGRLNDGANPADGLYDLRFSLFTVPTGGSLAAGFLTNSATVVSNGLFTVVLDFGAGVFDGTSYWLQIEIGRAHV